MSNFHKEPTNSGVMGEHAKAFVYNSPGQIYVIVTHKPTQTAFALNRQYQLMIREGVDRATREWWQVQALGDTGFVISDDGAWDGWFPSLPRQQPIWTTSLNKADFKAEWVVCRHCQKHPCECKGA